MAKAFSSIKTTLNLYDKLTFGKFKDCRICDILEDHLDYLQYLRNEKIVRFDISVTEAMEDHFQRKGSQVVKIELEKTDEYLLRKMHGRYDYTTREYEFEDWNQDVPF